MLLLPTICNEKDIYSSRIQGEFHVGEEEIGKELKMHCKIFTVWYTHMALSSTQYPSPTGRYGKHSTIFHTKHNPQSNISQVEQVYRKRWRTSRLCTFWWGTEIAFRAQKQWKRRLCRLSRLGAIVPHRYVFPLETQQSHQTVCGPDRNTLWTKNTIDQFCWSLTNFHLSWATNQPPTLHGALW